MTIHKSVPSPDSTSESNDLRFLDLFDRDEIQRIQELFSDATGLASLFTETDGTAITKARNHCSQLLEIILNTEKAAEHFTDPQDKPEGANHLALLFKPGLEGILLQFHAEIRVNGKHLADWFIGQVRTEETDEQLMKKYAAQIGADFSGFVKAVREVPVMTANKFQKVAELLQVYAKELSEKASLKLQLLAEKAERENSPETMLQRESNLAGTLNSIGNGIITTDLSGRVVGLNPVAEKLCGWEEPEALGKTLAEVFNILKPENLETETDLVVKVLESIDFVGFDANTVLVSRNGDRSQISYSAAPIKDKNGRISGVVLIFSDITEDYNALEKTRWNEEKFHSLYASMIEGAALHELKYNRQGEVIDYVITETNPAFEKQLGISRENVIGKTSREAYGVADPPFLDIYKGVALTAVPVVFEAYFPPLGKYFSISVYCPQKGSFATIFDDITDQKQAVESIRESEEKYRLLLENSGIGVGVYSLDGIIRLFNQKAIQNLGGNTEDYLGKSMFEVFGKEAGSVYLRRIREAAGSELSLEYEDHVITASGDYWFLSNHSRIVDSKGLVSGVQVLAHDITARKKAEEALLESEEKYRLIFENSPLGLISFDTKGIITACNINFLKIIGPAKERVLGLNLLKLPNRRLVSAIVKALKGEVGSFQHDYVSKTTGRSSSVKARFAAVLDGNGIIKGGTGIIEDITERKQAEEALRMSEEKFRNFFENSVVGKSITYIGGGMETNTTFLKILGYSQEELSHFSWQDITHPDDVETDQVIFDSILSGKEKSKRWEKRYLHKNGSITWVDISSTVQRDKNGNPLYFITSIMDITSRKRAEMALRESEKKYRLLTENIKDVVWTLDVDSLQFTYVSPSVLRLRGYTAEEVMAMPLSSAMNEGDATVMMDLVRTYAEGLRTGLVEPDSYFSYELQQPCKDGSQVWTEIVTSIYINPETGRVEVRGVSRDISERKEAEINTQKLGKHYQALIEKAPDGIVTIGPEGKFRYVSPSAMRLFGFRSEDELQISPDEYTHPDDLPMVLTQLAKIVEDPSYVPTLQYRFSDRNGNWRWVESTFTNLFSDPNVEAIVINFRDVTENRQAAEALQRSEELFKSIILNSSDVTTLTDENDRLLFISPQCRELFGFTGEDYLGKPIPYHIHPDDAAECLRQWGLLKSGGVEIRNYEYRVTDSRGIQKWISHTARPVIIGSQLLGFQSTLRDISERKKDELQIIEARLRAEESDRLKSAFLANMSHEIRTPMNGILGFSELLKEPDLSGEQQAYYIELIKKSGNRMLNIINDIIDISKIESGQLQLSLGETNVNEQMDFIYAFFKPETDRKGLQFTFSKTLPADEAVILTDREKIYAILTNLVKNAIKFTQQGFIEFGYLKKEMFIEFFVRDSGSGISPELMEIIFERFRQGSESTSRDYEGAGLGLSISKAYAEALGGNIRAKSLKGEGSVFYFTVPYNFIPHAKLLPKEISPAIPEGNSFGHLKILIAEDDEASILLITIALRKFGQQILTVSNGAAAVELLKEQPDIDLILMDVKMTEMDGYEATRLIREFNTKVVIIAQTAYGLESEREKALQAGCNDYLSKPINLELLKNLLKKHCKI